MAVVDKKKVVVFGGSGFVGSYACKALLKAGYDVVAVSRASSKPDAIPKQASFKTSDYNKKDLATILDGAYAVVNTIGILYETRQQKFSDLHIRLPKRIAKTAIKVGVQKFIHVSSLGVYAASEYGTTKKYGEEAVLKEFPTATILRPSVIFGREDNFFNLFVKLSKFSPFLPLIGGGKTKLQPVYVEDVAKAIAKSVTLPTANLKHNPAGKIYELGGPRIVTFKKVYELVLEYTKRSRILLPLPWWLAKLQASVLGLLPKPLLTPDQVKSLEVDNVVTAKSRNLNDLGITPTEIDNILPSYLGQ